jgi:hypothetical protein
VRRADRFVSGSAGTADLLRAKLPAHERDKVLLALSRIDNFILAHEANRVDWILQWRPVRRGSGDVASSPASRSVATATSSRSRANTLC